MLPIHGLRLLVAVTISLAFAASVGCEQGRTDQDGNPLPPGAIARMGGVRTRHEDAVTSVAFAPDGKTLASGSDDKTVRLWETATGKEIRQLQGQGKVCSVTFSPDGATLASASSDGTVRLWETATGKEIRQFQGHQFWVNSVVYSPDGKTLASGSSDKTVRLWNVFTGKEICQFQGYQSRVLSVVFSPDGKTLASAGQDDNTVRFWEAATGKEIRQFQGHEGPVWSVAYSPDGKILASGSWDKTARLWETASGKEIRQLRGHEGPVWSVAYSPDGKTLASGSSDKTVRLWEIATGKEIGKIQGQQDAVFSVIFSADGRTLASAGNNATILVWRLSEIYCGDSSTAQLDPKQMESLWADLGNEDAAKAYHAVGTLVVGAKQAVPFLQERFRHAVAPEDQGIARLLADLDADQFAVRDKAREELEQLGDLARPALAKVLAGQPSPEVRERVKALLNRLSTPTPERLRTMRAVMVLEQIGTPEAKQLVENLAKGAEGALLTEEARAARRRMKP